MTSRNVAVSRSSFASCSAGGRFLSMELRAKNGSSSGGGFRSGERRGGEEGRFRGAPDHLKKKKENGSGVGSDTGGSLMMNREIVCTDLAFHRLEGLRRALCVGQFKDVLSRILSLRMLFVSD